MGGYCAGIKRGRGRRGRLSWAWVSAGFRPYAPLRPPCVGAPAPAGCRCPGRRDHRGCLCVGVLPCGAVGVPCLCRVLGAVGGVCGMAWLRCVVAWWGLSWLADSFPDVVWAVAGGGRWSGVWCVGFLGMVGGGCGAELAWGRVVPVVPWRAGAPLCHLRDFHVRCA